MNSQNNPLISLKNVSMIREGKRILSDVNIEVNVGDFIAITGPNGGGKTTLLRIMLKLLKPTTGKVEYLKYNERPLTIGYLPQKNMIDSHFPISVREVVASGIMGIPRAEAMKRIDKILGKVGMSDHADQPIGALSGGQLQRALLGRAIISQPELLVLDEPLSYIDKRFESHFYELIAAIKETATIVLVSHEMTTISEMANRHLIVDQNIHECAAHHHYVRSECY